MALIVKLREKMGRLLVVIIGLAIMMFVLTDLFVGGGSAFLGQDNDVGEISVETVSFEEFQAQVDQLSTNFSFNAMNPLFKRTQNYFFTIGISIMEFNDIITQLYLQ